MRDLIMEFVQDNSITKLRNNNWQAMDQINECFEQNPNGYLRCNLTEIEPLTVLNNWNQFQPQAEQWVLNCLRSAKQQEPS